MKTTMLDKRERLLHMYNYAISNSICSNRKGFAEVIGISDKNLSNALSTNEIIADRFCTKGLLQKANAALNYTFNQQWLLTGEGEMYANNINNVHTPTPTHAHKTITPSYDDDDLEYLRKRVKELEYLVDLQKKRIEQLESEAKKGYASVSVS